MIPAPLTANMLVFFRKFRKRGLIELNLAGCFAVFVGLFLINPVVS